MARVPAANRDAWTGGLARAGTLPTAEDVDYEALMSLWTSEVPLSVCFVTTNNTHPLNADGT
eukprot:4747952-Amphidinium_carterae.1